MVLVLYCLGGLKAPRCFYIASFPGPAQLSVARSTEKRGEPGIFSHVSDVTTNEKLMNVGGLKTQRCYWPRAIVPAKMVRDFATSVKSVRFCRRLRPRSMNGSPE